MTAPPPAPGARVVLFDLDGTLTDSAPGILRSARHALEVLGRPDPGPERLRAFVGPPIQESFAALGLSGADVDRAVAAYRSVFAERGLYENAVYDGIPELLWTLGEAGFIWPWPRRSPRSMPAGSWTTSASGPRSSP